MSIHAHRSPVSSCLKCRNVIAGLAGSFSCACLLFSLDAHAADERRTQNTIEEVIVSATKRDERLQDVPMSIAVVTNQDIERRGLIGMEDYLRAVPGVNQIDRGGADNAIVIRGISTSPESENFSTGTTVATYFDETPITGAGGVSGGGIDVRPVDLERIEVLRGPQGTAYGSSSLGGTLRTIPARPELDEFGAKVSASYSDTGRLGSGNSMMQGVVNAPVVKDTFGLRFVGYKYEDSGFYKNIAGIDSVSIARADAYGIGNYVRGYTQEDIGRLQTVGGRASALWRPTEKLELAANYLSQRIEQDGRPESDAGSYQQSRIQIAPQVRLRDAQSGVADTDLDLVNLVLTYDMGWSTLTMVGSRVDGGSTNSQDVTAATSVPLSTINSSDFEAATAEARIATSFEGPLQFLGGVFYEDVQEDFLNTLNWPGAPSPTPRFITNPASISQRTRELDQRAVFGELAYHFTEKFSATAGARYFEYDKEEHIIRREGGVFNVPLGGTIPSTLSSSDTGETYKANLSFKATPDSLVYASWSQGFRLGRPDVGALPAVCDLNRDGIIDGGNNTIESSRKIDSDFLDNYEIGGKVSLFGGRMTVDGSIYHIVWDGVPIRVVGLGGCNYTANAGEATSDGAEVQASFFPLGGLRFDIGVGYTNAELAEDAPGLRAAEGARLPGSPELNASLAVEYSFDVAGYAAFVRGDSFYVGDFYGNVTESPLTKAGDYVKVDARTGIEINSLTVELFVRNLTNEDAYTWRGLSNSNSAFGYQMRPRTVGVQLGYKFE